MLCDQMRNLDSRQPLTALLLLGGCVLWKVQPLHGTVHLQTPDMDMTCQAANKETGTVAHASP